MTVSEHIESDTREHSWWRSARFAKSAIRKPPSPTSPKCCVMSPANVYRFFDSKKAINEGVARGLMGEVEDAAHAIVIRPGPAADRLRELLTTVHRMNSGFAVNPSCTRWWRSRWRRAGTYASLIC